MRIRLQAVSKKYAKVHALKDVSFTIEPGQIVCALGANGAGKTTLLRCLGAIVSPSSGHIYFDEDRFTRGNLDLRRRMGFLPDFPIAFAHNTVLRHIGMVLRLYEKDDPSIEPRVIELLKAFDLLPLIDTPMVQLSRGQVYKAGLVSLLAADCELFLLDEPFASGMDPTGISAFKREARSAAGRGHTILYSTQILDIAEKLSDWVCLLDKGEVRQFAPVRDLATVSGGQGGVLEALFQQLRETAR